MFNIVKLFGKSPFSPLQKHIKMVAACINQLPDLFAEIEKQNEDKISLIAKEISQKEYEADLIKNDIRNHLPRSLFLPINRADFLSILHLQDSLADKAEDIAIITTLKKIEHFSDLKDLFNPFLKESINSFTLSLKIIEEMSTLIESSFGGIEADKVKKIIKSISKKEYEIDNLQYDLLKKLYIEAEKMHFSSFHQWTILIKEIGAISNIGENLGNRIHMILES